MKLTNNIKIWMAILIVLILVVNIFTAVRLVKYFSLEKESDNTQNTTVADFKTPDKIILHNGEKKTELTPDSESFDEILSLNQKRTEFLEFLTQLANIDPDSLDAIFIEYQYDEPCSLTLKLDSTVTDFSVNKISFVLTGEYNGYTCVYSNDSQTTVGILTVNSELIRLVKEL